VWLASCPCQAMQIGVNFTAVAEKKPLAQRILSKTCGDACLFNDLAQLGLASSSECLRHTDRRHCNLATNIDVISAGLPCHPFSFARYTGGTSQNTGPTEQHEEYTLVMETFPEVIRARRPGLGAKLFSDHGGGGEFSYFFLGRGSSS